jgi:hypothetical protein
MAQLALAGVQPMPYTIAVGNTFKAIRGCDRTFETCRTVFNNVLNFEKLLAFKNFHTKINTLIANTSSTTFKYWNC